MPLYEFDCPACGEPFEKRVSFADDLSEVTCPTCGGQHVQKKLSAFAVKSGGVISTAAPSNEIGGCANGMCGLPFPN